jgi:hypothetical protein
MAKIEITSTSLVVQIEGFDRFLALISGLSGGVKARLEVPLEHVAGVDASVPEAHQFWKGWTVAALSLPYSVTVGQWSRTSLPPPAPTDEHGSPPRITRRRWPPARRVWPPGGPANSPR